MSDNTRNFVASSAPDTKKVSLASIVAAMLAPLAAWSTGHVQQAELYVALAAIVVVKHHGNIRRLLAGEENRFSLSGTKARPD